MIRLKESILALSCSTLLLLGGCGGSPNKDVTIPVISLEGSASVILEAGSAYTDAGATAADNVDGSITSSIVTVNPVDINTVGTYTVTYSVSDAAGNAATAVTRTVVIVEPVLTGYFTDSAVEGLTYKTDTQTGVTDLNGAFTYQAGETVVFSIGDFVLGESATATPQMTPLDLIPNAFLPTTRNELLPLLENKTINTAEAIAFRTLINMLTFLQALDNDKDASNGITIADGMGIVLEDVSIDFAEELTRFKEALPLRRVMRAAVTQNLISSGFIKKPGQALNHFYEAQEISHSFKSIETKSVDNDNDNDIYQNPVYYTYKIATYTYDSDGNILTLSVDTDANGEPAIIYYDDYGNFLTTYSGSSTYTYTYDSDGNMLTSSVDTDADGEPKNRIATYTYDSDGNMLTRNSGSSTYTSTYDSDGNMLTSSVDTDADGEPNETSTYTYDSDGNMLTESKVNMFTGSTGYDLYPGYYTYSITTYTYDSDGNILTLSVDTDAIGSPNETITTFTYDDYGNRCITYPLYNYNLLATIDDEWTQFREGNSDVLDSGVLDIDVLDCSMLPLLNQNYDENGYLLNNYGSDDYGNIVTTTYTYVDSSIGINIEELVFNLEQQKLQFGCGC